MTIKVIDYTHIVELVWHDVKEKMPELKKWGSTEMVLISIHNMRELDEDADEWEKNLYTPFFTSTASLKKLSTGCAVWIYEEDVLVEEGNCVVTHWAEMPKPVVVEGAETK